MDLNLKPELFGEIPSVVDVSSDDDIAVRPSTPETNCSICLEELNNKCYSDSCWHLFCFECLKRWSTIQPSCPLCKKEFKCIYHAFNDQGSHETFEIPRQIAEISSTATVFYSNADNNSVFRMNLFLDIVRRNERLLHQLSNSETNDPDFNIDFNMHSNTQLVRFHPRIDLPHGQTMRIRVYSENLWADPLPDLSGRYRDCSTNFYRENQAQIYRLHDFILRDLTAIRTVERTEGVIRHGLPVNDHNLTTLIMQSVSSYDIRDMYMISSLRPYIGNHSAHFVHELYNYAHSPYDLIGYDRNVRYSIRPIIPTATVYQGLNVSDVFEETPRIISPVPIPPNPRFSETIVLDTDDEEVETNSRLYGQEIIIVSSTNEDSDVEILSHSYLPPRTLDSSRDQPSTSTGIRDSLDRPNNRYNLRRRRLFSPIINESISGCPVHLSRMTYPAGLRRGRINLDSSSSSDDDDSFTPTSGSQTMHMKNTVVLDKNKRKVKKKKLRKRKRNVDNSLSELHFGSRSHSNSGSSSSFSDTDTRPNNNCLPLRTNILL